MRIVVVALVVAFWLVPATPDARDITATENTALEARIAAFDTAIRANDYATVISIVPPRLFETIATDNHLPVERLREVVAEQMSTIFEGATIETFRMDLAAAEHRQLPGGEPYLLLPTTTVIVVPSAGRVQFDTKTLAVAEGGTWYLVRLDDPTQIDVLRRAYPEFAGETFPLGASRQLPAQ